MKVSLVLSSYTISFLRIQQLHDHILMPQFDIFSFFSQLFWVFFGFLNLYLVICYYLLPALASILKIRKQKLSQITTNSNATLQTNSNFSLNIKTLIDDFYNKLNTITSNLSSKTQSIVSSSRTPKQFKSLSVNFEVVREFNLTIFTKTRIVSLLLRN